MDYLLLLYHVCCLRFAPGVYRVFRKLRLEIFARACGAHRGIIVEVVAGFRPATTSTMILQSGPHAGHPIPKATLEKKSPGGVWGYDEGIARAAPIGVPFSQEGPVFQC